jgi:ankyrin repeat protein
MPHSDLDDWLDAAYDGDVDGLHTECRRGRYINSTDEKGRTALHFAAREGHYEAVR